MLLRKSGLFCESISRINFNLLLLLSFVPSHFFFFFMPSFVALFLAFLFYEIMTGYLSRKGKTLSGINSG